MLHHLGCSLNARKLQLNIQFGLIVYLCGSLTRQQTPVSFILLWTCHWAFTGPDSQQHNFCKNRLFTSIKLCLVMLKYSRLMVMSWNNVMPPTRLACSTFMNACGVTDVVCHRGLPCPRMCMFVFVWFYVFMYTLCLSLINPKYP